MASIGISGNVVPHVLDPAAGRHIGNLPITLKVAAVDAEPIGARGAYSHCDGVADEVEIQAAIALAAALGHGIRVELTDGHFYVTGSIITVPEVHIVGAGRATTIVVPAGCNFPIITSSNLADLHDAAIKSLYIDGVTNGGPGAMTDDNDALCLHRCQHVLIEDVYADNVGGDGIWAPTPPVNAYTNWIKRCCFNGCGIGGIELGQARFIMAYNEVDNSVDQGIYIEDSPRALLIGNHAHNNGADGIWVGFNCDNCIIVEGNTCEDNGLRGITIDLSSECIIKGNTLKGNGGDGLLILGPGSLRTIVTGNVTIGNVGDQISDFGTDSIIRDNVGHVTENKGIGTIVNPATTAVIAHGLSVTPAAEDIIITLMENPTADPGNIWVDTIDAVNFTVNCRNAPGVSDLDFGWQVQVV